MTNEDEIKNVLKRLRQTRGIDLIDTSQYKICCQIDGRRQSFTALAKVRLATTMF